MPKLILTAACATTTLALALAGCDYNKQDYNEANASYNAEGSSYEGSAADYNAATSATASSWPEGARIVEEGGVTYRIDPGGARVRLEPSDSRIVVENGVRYRVDPGGTRVRIDDTGAIVSVGPDGVETTVPVSGNTSVTVNSQ
jgi:hypothetical protein